MDNPDNSQTATDSETGHIQIIETLARDVGYPIETVSQVFVSALEKLRSSARIQDYLVVLTSKQVRDMLHH